MLKEILQNIAREDYPTESRVHPLQLGKDQGIVCYAKREDELGCLISGSKVRKFSTLIAALKQRGCKKMALIGGEHSNQILGLTSLLIENQIEPVLYLLKTRQNELIGNALFTRAFVTNAAIHYVERSAWPNVEALARSSHKEVIPEGGALADCIGGLATLALDILRNEEALGIVFGELLIDSGSGLTAASLIATFGLLKRQIHIHVSLGAGSDADFLVKLEEAKVALESLAGEKIASFAPFSLHRPPVAKAFGSTNAAIFRKVIEVARSEGMLLEPLYSAKLFLLAEELISKSSLRGPLLFIHSGGLFSLSGFTQQMHGALGC